MNRVFSIIIKIIFISLIVSFISYLLYKTIYIKYEKNKQNDLLDLICSYDKITNEEIIKLVNKNSNTTQVKFDSIKKEIILINEFKLAITNKKIVIEDKRVCGNNE